MKKLNGLFIVLGGLAATALPAMATGAADANISAALDGATATFALIVTLAVTVTAFFIGRSWLRRVK